MPYLETECSIWRTQYTLINHRCVGKNAIASVTLKGPYVKWTNGEGVLAFRKKTFYGKLAIEIKNAFKNKTKYLEGYISATLYDALNGELGDGWEETLKSATEEYKKKQRLNKSSNGDF